MPCPFGSPHALLVLPPLTSMDLDVMSLPTGLQTEYLGLRQCAADPLEEMAQWMLVVVLAGVIHDDA
eukprot:797790-Amphidinium_carterae.3